MADERTPAEIAATENYLRRSAAFARALSEGTPDPNDPPFTEQERTMLVFAHRRLGKAIEGEVFGDRPEQGEGSAQDALQGPESADPQC